MPLQLQPLELLLVQLLQLLDGLLNESSHLCILCHKRLDLRQHLNRVFECRLLKHRHQHQFQFIKTHIAHNSISPLFLLFCGLGCTHVDSKAQYWGGSRAKGSVAVMDVLSPAKGDAASVGYLDWENLSFSWTFRRTEVLVVLEGDLNLSIEGTTFSAAHGDVFSIPAGTEVELSSSGHVRCATVAVAA